MSHCPYLLHKFIINYLFDYHSVCLVYSSYVPTALSIFYRGDCSTPALRVATPIWLWLLKMIEIYNIAAQPYYWWWTHAYSTTLKQSHHMPHLHIYCLKRRSFVASYVQPITQQYESTTTCLPQNRHFLWWTKMNGTQSRAVVSPWRIHCMYSGMAKGTSRAEVTSNSEKNQACSLSHCWVMRVWRHQTGS